MSYQQVAEGQASPEVPINENMEALGQGFTFAHDVTADTGLVVGITRGRFNGATLADTTVTCTNDATNYIVANRSTGAVSTSTATTNWDNTGTYGRVGIAIFASGVLTYHDERSSSGGIFDHGAAAPGGVSSVNGETGAVTITASDLTDFAEAVDDRVAALLAGAGLTLTYNDAGNLLTIELPAQPYDVGGGCTGAPSASLVLMRYPVPRAITFPASLTNSRGVAATAATAQTDFDILRNGVSFGTMRFAASGTTASFIAASQTAFVAGDVLTVVAPATPDATLAHVGFSLAATR